ncbi:expressed unknown protein [Seminavis robusta]|uniref:Uncharacterized protein n=1 Tax=Seminavis robusta TaxID=568900 RepID=A0A9N8DWH8_9STRA|nr:expressed unknown protein [Seminavis robusta]|eukprot:Sro429_g141000.1 n/a (260) ;mRNA; r:13388-14167
MDDVVTSIYALLNEKSHHSNLRVVQVVREDVVDLNDRAVGYMLKHDFQSALQTLQRALAHIMALQAHPQALKQRQVHVSSVHKNDETSIASISLGNSHHVKSEPFDGIFLFFNRAMVIPHHCDFDLYCPKDQSRALAAVLYNIALVYHMEAIRCGQHQTTLLNHALHYYGFAYRTIESAAPQYGFQDVLVLLLALFNNMGHAHSMLLDNVDLTRQCLQWMQSTFANPRVKRQLFPEDYQFFFQYISVAASRQLLLAPAA